jgi:hypothetical protein
VPGILPAIAKSSVFRGFFADFRRGVVTLHQELNGITHAVASEKGLKEPKITGGSLSLTHDNL